MWVIALDKNLRQLYMKKIGGAASGPIEECIPRIAKALRWDKLGCVTYYAFARLDTDLPEEYSGAFERQEEVLRLAPELIAHELLGTYLSNGKDLYRSGPRYSFRDYLGMEHLPRTAILPGPHEYPCECLACTQHEEMLRANRERQRPIDASTGEGLYGDAPP